MNVSDELVKNADLEMAIKTIALGIWEKGELKNGWGCLVPTWFDGYPHHDIIVEELDATHFSRTWKTRGKIVLMSFFGADCFGACDDDEMKHIADFEVDIND